MGGIGLQAASFSGEKRAWPSRYLGMPLEFTNSIGMKFVLIPPGQFMMGPPEEKVGGDSRMHAGSHSGGEIARDLPQAVWASDARGCRIALG